MSGTGTTTFEFDEEFQSTVVAMICRDADFNIRIDGLIKPDYFSNELEAGIASVFLDYFGKYRTVPAAKGVVTELLKDGIKRKLFRKEMVADLPAKLAELSAIKVSDRDFVIDQVQSFARHQAFKQAILDSVELVEKGKFDEAEKKVREANEVGAGDALNTYDYFEMASARRIERDDVAAGKIKLRGITTGVPVLDELLAHGGWGRKELSLYMGGPKSGKTTALIDHAQAASMAGYKALYLTLEVSAKIVADRLDANISEFELQKLMANASDVERRVMDRKAAAGTLYIHEFPSGTLQPRAISRLLSRYKSQGQKFDLIVVDYADLMAPNYRYPNPIENSKSIYVDLRAIAQMEDAAMLSATQTNREGVKQAVQRMEHVSDDFNKVRTADLILSINADENERKAKEARIYFVASRNQADGMSLRVKTALERAKFISGVLSVES